MRINHEALPSVRLPVEGVTDRLRKALGSVIEKEHKRLVATIICGDEGFGSIEKTIESLKFCDLIIISFNGSDDNYKSLNSNIKNNRVDIFKSTFDNFALARNTCLNRIRYSNIDVDWCIWVDSDDVCSEELQKGLLKAIEKVEIQDKDNSIDKIELEVENNEAKETFTQIRIYKPHAVWEGIVHEQIHSEGKTAKILGGKIIHYGYDDENRVTEKRIRNIKLLEQSIREIGINPADCIALGRTLLMSQAPVESLKWFYAATIFELDEEDYGAIDYYLGRAMESLGQADMAIKYYDSSTHPDAEYALACLRDDNKAKKRYFANCKKPGRYGTQYDYFAKIEANAA